MASSERSEIRWLHLSDFHFRANIAWSQDIVLRSLLEDIETRYGASRHNNRLDLLFLTGDIAFSGQPEEYRLAEEFVRELMHATGVSPDGLFIIPGNHDIDRSIEEDAFRGVQQSLSTETEVDRFFANDGRCRTLFRRQAAFREFVRRVAPPSSAFTDTSFAHWKTTTVGPVQIAALLLDSAWLAGGGELDTGRLLVGERQVIDAHSSLVKPALVFGLCHHPFAWLKDFEQVAIENLLLERVSIMLRGHVHSADIRAIEALERRLIFFTAGATFETRTAHNTYICTAVDLLTGRGTCTTHNYVHAAKRWEATEPKPWRLCDPKSVALRDAVEILNHDTGPFRAYKTLLLTGHATEVPREASGTYVFLSAEISLPGDSNPIGKAILALRHLLTWRSAWDAESWDEKLSRQLVALDAALTSIAGRSAELRAYIEEKERICRENIDALAADASLQTSSFVQNLIQLEARREFGTILQLIERARHANVLTANEARQLADLEVRALLGSNDVTKAVECVTALLAHDTPSADRLYLAAQCQYDAHGYAKAALHMHAALDLGMPVNQARRLALLIAGQAGDHRLTERVMKHG